MINSRGCVCRGNVHRTETFDFSLPDRASYDVARAVGQFLLRHKFKCPWLGSFIFDFRVGVMCGSNSSGEVPQNVLVSWNMGSMRLTLTPEPWTNALCWNSPTGTLICLPTSSGLDWRLYHWWLFSFSSRTPRAPGLATHREQYIILKYGVRLGFSFSDSWLTGMCFVFRYPVDIVCLAGLWKLVCILKSHEIS